MSVDVVEQVSLLDDVWWWYNPEADWQTPMWAKGILLKVDDHRALVAFAHKSRGLGKRWVLRKNVVVRIDDEIRPSFSGSPCPLMHEWANEQP